MTRDSRTMAAASGPREEGTEPHAPALVHHVASRFVQTYSLTRVDPEFDQLFAETVEVWHSFDHETTSLPGREFAGAMLRMLRATAEIVRDHSDRIWSLKVDHDGFALAATASGELGDGTPVHISRCLLVTVHEGRITRICEFGDQRQRAPLDEALRAAGRFRS
ncbi:nuclear transport factor 2 family protein [Allokutzneria oryzae]|uniref:Nuclear transport factor 2 family protein n=1 Tax=Allokutzneria oryzae TaxID=1378989 RepID=A0ABV5ZU39_9PSEU